MRKIRSILAIILLSFFTAFWGSVGVFVSLFAVKYLIKCSVRPWGKTVLWACGVRLDVKGTENFPDGPFIVMFNHQSSFDIPAFSAALPFEWKAVMKQEVASIPFIGWVCTLSGQHLVARDGSVGDTNKVREIVRKIRKGPSVIIAPEGTRSEDGTLLPFKQGGFFMASLSRVPVVPVVIWGGKDIRKKGSYELNTDRDIVFSILPPVDTAGFPKGKEGGRELEGVVREKMLCEIEKIRCKR